MEDIIILFSRNQYANPLRESKRVAVEQDIFCRAGKRCVVMPSHILGGVVAGDVLVLRTCHSYRQGGRAEEEDQLSAMVGMKCVLLEPHISDVLVIQSTEQGETTWQRSAYGLPGIYNKEL